MERFSDALNALNLALEEWTPEEFAAERLADVSRRSFFAADPLCKTFSVIWPFGLVVKADSQDFAVMKRVIAVSAEDHAFIYPASTKSKSPGTLARASGEKLVRDLLRNGIAQILYDALQLGLTRIPFHTSSKPRIDFDLVHKAHRIEPIIELLEWCRCHLICIHFRELS